MTEPALRSPLEIVARLTVEERASLTSGLDFWHTEPIARENIPSIMLTDGPHGVRKQTAEGDHLGLHSSVPATCFPPAVALGCSFDPELLERVGAALGAEARALQVGVLLGPGINIKRSPLCGRNFEYLSEDPLLSGVLGAALVRGLQSQGVGASLKHFAANNQETDRMRVSADVDPRPLREIYLRAFERVVRDAQPWTVMCSYNRINGVYSSRNPWLLTDVLRDEWGFEGLVVSDWGAVDDRVASLAAGLDLEMPSTGGRTDAEIVAAVRAGTVDESVLDTAAARVIELVQKAVAASDPRATFDADAHHALAREVAGQSIVLLRNENDLLPLATDANIAVIGELARTPRYQGAGSSRIEPTRLDNALDEIRSLSGRDVPFAAGYALDGSDSAALVDEAVKRAADADIAVVFLGVPAELESEGFDRDDLELPHSQIALLDAVLVANPKVVVVLSNGGVVRLSGFAHRVPAIVEGWLLGQAGGGAVADVLYGQVNPSGRLAETVPIRLEDTPAHTNFPGEHGHVRYGEGLFVGYRSYDARRLDVSFPFGHGLSYTTFEYADAAVESDGDLTVHVTVTNTGERAGAEVVQVYVGVPDSSVARAPRELKGFTKVRLDPGESQLVAVHVRRDDLAYWDTRVDSWVVEGGTYSLEIGASSRDIRQTLTVDVEGDSVRIPLTMESSLGELFQNPEAAEIVLQAFGSMGGDVGIDESVLKMAASMPLGRLAGFAPGVEPEQIQQLLDVVNQQK
ncbi:glycoside hydrolase family 3 C-terminal domain-containing protein [Rhodococcus rhodochrous]|uniref:glycoside hydrolase family 3 C-terminal domain-containing protein n=1 Tax=Rhodococcus rhodochrous TaxID=1829 RepID=UPI001E4D9BF9|nr:glycoside hydrolase family 3 C-terminal domain-containing protein [Rhodococcus rhodochrous]MCD2100135.1 glycoside hydrolase family 3 C-terminal domain-containing protein [Rhodococcus rhodochrous]MCD2124517.1 glycoside hydrolase family 3 C-terminal domain-containing protein [Rhodococcus rhodochrous]MCQ4137402.1 glycoside hydrolase family 3 C-terminal domain-containing protein [Rhodococcus rhodochrous]MDJ0021289.1 glycoside hydrolase family 3 C-terminal domain-containing protein [Rhodococcus r